MANPDLWICLLSSKKQKPQKMSPSTTSDHAFEICSIETNENGHIYTITIKNQWLNTEAKELFVSTKQGWHIMTYFRKFLLRQRLNKISTPTQTNTTTKYTSKSWPNYSNINPFYEVLFEKSIKNKLHKYVIRCNLHKTLWNIGS